MSMCSQSAPWVMVSAQALPSDAKSAERMEGAIIGAGGMVATCGG